MRRIVVDQPAAGVVFLGDLSDPWVAEIADAFPDPVTRVDLVNTWPESCPQARVVVAHRTILTVRDAEAIKAIKSRPGPSTRVILCVGPQIRAADLERWAGGADVILPEATASQVIARHVADHHRPLAFRPIVSVVSSLFEPRRLFVDCCAAAGFGSRAFDDWPEAPSHGLVVWDVPLLSPSWEAVLRKESSRRSVVCLMGFADRDLVARAAGAGASGWLDLPFDPADLAFVLDRVASRPVNAYALDQPHAVPPQMKIARAARLPLAVRGSGS